MYLVSLPLKQSQKVVLKKNYMLSDYIAVFVRQTILTQTLRSGKFEFPKFEGTQSQIRCPNIGPVLNRKRKSENGCTCLDGFLIVFVYAATNWRNIYHSHVVSCYHNGGLEAFFLDSYICTHVVYVFVYLRNNYGET